MSEYFMSFIELSHHSPYLVSANRDRVNRFIEGLVYSLKFGKARELEAKAPLQSGCGDY